MTTDLTALPKLPTLPPRPEGDSLQATMYAIADVLRYPQDSKGRVYDVTFLMPILAFHLARAGCVIDRDRALIKARLLPPAPGVIEGAVEWVSVHAPDGIEDELDGATLDDLDRLSPAARAELMRRLGGDPATVPGYNPDVVPQLDDRAPWHVETSIHFDDEESP
jgi:hypothetical protein